MTKNYFQAPLPFQGQKRRWNAEFKRALSEFDNCNVFVDLFGGSGLLSRMVKDVRPDAVVFYNDFDDYHVRIENINRTNALLADLRLLLSDCPDSKLVNTQTRLAILARIKSEELTGFVDYITLSSSLLFSMKYVTNYEELSRESFYNKCRQTEYSAEGYLDGLSIVKMDYRELFNRWRHYENVCFLIDPPYLSTDAGTYTGYWRLGNYLDVLQTLNNSNYFYFTSNKSSIVELCDWLEVNYEAHNPFHGANRIEQKSHINYSASYVDIMLYKKKGNE